MHFWDKRGDFSYSSVLAGLTIILSLEKIGVMLDSDQNYFIRDFSFACDSSSGEAFVIELIIAALVVFFIRRLQKAEELVWMTRLVGRTLVVEDDFGRTLVAFSILVVLQFIFISPYGVFTQDESEISDLKSTTNQIRVTYASLEKSYKDAATNNLYLHDQWTAEVALRQNYQEQNTELNKKLQQYTSFPGKNNIANNLVAGVNPNAINSNRSSASEDTEAPTFDLFMNHKYVSNGAIIQLEPSKEIFFQVQNTGNETATNLTITVESPLNETNFIFDSHWTKVPLESWIPRDRRTYDLGDSFVIQLITMANIPAQGFLNVEAFDISPSLPLYAASIEKWERAGFESSDRSTDPGSSAYLPLGVTVEANNSKLEVFTINLQL
jgi:hypothetical protein